MSDKKEIQNLVFYEKPKNIINKTRPAAINQQPNNKLSTNKPLMLKPQIKPQAIKPQEKEEEEVKKFGIHGKKIDTKPSKPVTYKNPFNNKK